MARLSEEHYKALGQETPRSKAMNRLTRVFRKDGSRKSLSPLPDGVEPSPASSGSPDSPIHKLKKAPVKTSEDGKTELEKEAEPLDPAVDGEASSEGRKPRMLTCRYLRADGAITSEDVYQMISTITPKESAKPAGQVSPDFYNHFRLQLFFHDEVQGGFLCSADYAYPPTTFRSDEPAGHFFEFRSLGYQRNKLMGCTVTSDPSVDTNIAAENADPEIRKVNILKEVAHGILRAYNTEPEQLTLGPLVFTNGVFTARLHKSCLILLFLSTLLFTWLHPRLTVFLFLVVGPILWNYDVLAWLKNKERSMEEVLAFEDKARKWLVTEPIMCLSQEILEGVDWKGFKFYLGHFIGSFVYSIPEKLDRAYGFGAVVAGYKATQKKAKAKTKEE